MGVQEPQETTTNRAEPELLYHYTDQKGLIGILGGKEKCIWATHINYLNDTSEGRIFADLLLSGLKYRQTLEPRAPVSPLGLYAGLLAVSIDGLETGNPHLDEALDSGTGAFSWIRNQGAFVASFSAKADLLSQWRAYSDETGGYSIGFARSYLNSVGLRFLERRKESFHQDANPLVECRYCDQTEEESVTKEIERVIDSYLAEAGQAYWRSEPQMKEGLKRLGAIAKRHFFPLGRHRAITKHRSFYEEAEWRLVFQLERTGTPGSEPEFRLGRSMPVPYFKVDLTCENQAIEIPEIIVGPCPDPDRAKNSVEGLLRKAGVERFKVKHSVVPYRNW